MNLPEGFSFFFYATAQLTPNAVPTAARIADARFHRNFINLDLFSLVIIFFYSSPKLG